MKLSEVKQKYSDEWLAFRVNSNGDDPDGELVFHHPDRERFRKAIKEKKLRNVYITFAGEVMEADVAAFF